MPVPKLRFKDKDGKAFPEWRSMPLSFFVDDYKGGAPLTPEDFTKNGKYEVIPKKAISANGKLQLDKENPTYCSEIFFNSNLNSVVCNSYLITTLRDLVPTGPSIGYIVEFEDNTKYLLAQGVYGFKLNNLINKKFLIQYSNSVKYRLIMQKIMVGSTQVHIRTSEFLKVSIPFPQLTEQTKIADFLTTLDTRINQQEKQCQLLEHYKKGIMQQIFSQQLRFKDDKGKDFPEWEEKEIGELFTIKRGNVLATSKLKESKDNDYCFPVYSSQTKNNGLLGYYNESLFENAITWTTDGANAGDTNFRQGSFYCTNVCGVLISENGYANKCIAELLNQITYRYVSYVGNPKLMNNVMATISINIPSSIIEQTKIANFLTAIDDKITLAKTQLTELNSYKKGLLQQLFI